MPRTRHRADTPTASQAIEDAPPCCVLDVAVLDPLHAFVCLEGKRALACTNKEVGAFMQACLCQKFLYVDYWQDISHANARFIVDRLMPKVWNLTLCAKDEELSPAMHLAALRSEPRITLRRNGKTLGATAAYFLGYALASSNCVVRLTTGKTKSLSALRESDSVHITWEEMPEECDSLVLLPAMAANAARRVDLSDTPNYRPNLSLRSLMVHDPEMRPLAARIRQMAWLRELDLSDNACPDVARFLFDPNGRFEAPKGCAFPALTKLNFADTVISCGGAARLAHAIRYNQMPKLRELLLVRVALGDVGLEALAKQLRKLVDLRRLDLSRNGQIRKRLHVLVDPANLPLPSLEWLNLNGLWQVTPHSWDMLARAVKAGGFPRLQSVATSTASARTPLRLALSVLIANRDWDAHEARCARGGHRASPTVMGDNDTEGSDESQLYDHDDDEGVDPQY